ncbi:MFS transporter [Robbsia andropogonis]|uniref:MFS transporter n=1 Tax=Robbsia andropogonis TaxID=28092 RepID=UPI00209EAC95|nr:MFS transporter [Robbsia andropogonis]MCP1116870.1 MFS transporter [Robbsia andropogonis]MCP1126451.1 MFS transporter [Robbsia andropogonis]
MAHANNSMSSSVTCSGGKWNLVVALCFGVIVTEGYDSAVMGAIVPALMHYGPWQLGPAEIGAMSSAALFGTLIGCYLISVIGDFAGRKPLLIGCVTLFSLSMVVSALAPSPLFFTLARGVGGLGLGGVISVSAALTVEFSSPERKNFNFALMYSGYFVGALLSALVALFFMEKYTWRFVIAVGGLPLLYLPVLLRLLPESPLHLISRGRVTEAREIARHHGLSLESLVASNHAEAGKPTIGRLFREIFLSGNFFATTSFWIAQIAAVLNLYGIGTWLPQIMRQMGYNLGSSLAFLATFMLGSGIGGILIGRYADRFGPRKSVLLTYTFGAACLIALSMKSGMIVTYCLIALAGLGTGGVAMVQLGLIANYYAPHARGTATGWAAGVGRFGAMAGPLVGGFILRQEINVAWNFYIFAAAAVCAGIATSIVPPRKASDEEATAVAALQRG